MPKVVVNLDDLDTNISYLTDIIKKYKEAQEATDFVLETHSIDNEIKHLNQFRQLFDLAIAKKNSQIFEDLAKKENKQICDLVKENDGELSVPDKYGNTFYPPPFRYRYVELSYGSYKKFTSVRFLGYKALVIPARFELESVTHNISPTTLKLLENLHKIKEEQTKDNILDTILKSDEACKRVKSGKKPVVKDWRYFFTSYFYEPVKFKKKENAKFPKFEYENKFDKEELKKYLDSINQNKQEIEQQLKKAKIESKSDPKKESPSNGSKQDSETQGKTEELLCEEDGRQNLLGGVDKYLNNLDKNLERQIENWQRRFDPNCIIKDLKDCLIPPDIDLCDFFFKDISIPKFYQKLRILHTAGLGDLYLQIEKKLENEFGVTELKEKDQQIKALEKLIEEEDSIRDTLNEALEKYEANLLSLTEDLRPLTEQYRFVQQQLEAAEISGRQGEITRLQKRIDNLSKRISRIQQKIETLRRQNEALPGNIDRLNVNYDNHVSEKEKLEKEFSDKIAQNKYNEKQAILISQGKNLEAIFLEATEGEQRSPESISTSIVNAIDTVVPLENLCKLLLQLTLSSKIQLPAQVPEDFWDFLDVKFKDPYFNLSADLWKLFRELLAILIFNLLDAMLNALCDSVGNIISNSIEERNAFEGVLQNAKDVAISRAIETSVAGLNTIASGNIAQPPTTGSSDVIGAITQTGANFSESLLDWVLKNDQPSPYSQWEISLDGKSFVINNPPLFDLSQVEQFIRTNVENLIEQGQQYSTQALLDMLSDSAGGGEITLQNPPEQRVPLTIQESKQEMSCLFSRVTSLLTPTETINLLTKKPSQDTINIVNKLAEICAPNMANSFPGDSLSGLLGDIGILAGALEIEEKLQEIQDLNENLPITEKVLCERYDNTLSFRQGLMAGAIDPELAGEILDEIENKKQEEMSYIIDSISSLAEGNILEKPQTAKQFYSNIISQVVDMQKQGKNPKSMSELDSGQSNSEKIDIKQVLEQKLTEDNEKNAALNAMFELTSESLIRPFKDRFRRDSESYIESISSNISYEKEIKKTQTVQTEDGPQEVPNMDFLNMVNMGYVPAIEITEGTVTIYPEIEASVASAEREKKEILNFYETSIEEYGFYSELEQTIPNAKEKALADLEIIKTFSLTKSESRKVKNKDEDFNKYYKDVEEKYLKRLSPEQLPLLMSDGIQTIRRYFEVLSTITLNKKDRKFVTSGVIASNIKIKMIPSHVLSFSNKIGSKTILTNRFFDSSTETNKLTLDTIDGTLLISNGYVEDNFLYSIYEQQDKKLYTVDSKQEVGQKYLDSINAFKRNLIFEIDEEVFSISLSSKHSASLSNPLLSRPDLFNINEESISYDSVMAQKPTLETLQCAAKQIGNPLNLPQEILSSLTKQLPLKTQLIEAIPLWKIEFSELFRDNVVEKETSVKTTGLSFSPSGMYHDFYHDTVFAEQNEAISEDIREILLRKFDKIPSRFVAFKRFLGVDTQELSLSLPPDSPFANSTMFGEQETTKIDIYNDIANSTMFGEQETTKIDIYNDIAKEIRNNFEFIFKDTRLLNNNDEGEQKLIELLDFTREPTEYEKENSTDPNIMNFIDLKKQFSRFYSLEKEEELSEEQIKGEKASENKATKAAKNTLLISFIRICVSEYILKNIFIFDTFSYDKKFSKFDFIVKDISNFVCQEAKRVQIGKELQKQSVRYYDLMTSNGDIEGQQKVETQFKDWKKQNSFSSTVCNPKMVKIVQQEFDNILNKFSSLFNCGDSDQQTDQYVDKIIKAFANRKETRTETRIIEVAPRRFTAETFVEPGTDIYVEKYVKIPGLTAKGITTLETNTIKEIKHIEEKEIQIEKLISIMKIIGEDVENFFNCDSDENLFREPVTFGAKLMMRSTGLSDDYQYDISVEEYLIDPSILTGREAIKQTYNDIYDKILYPNITKSDNTQMLFKYCFGFDELIQIFLTHCFLYHNDQDARFLFEGTKMMISRMYSVNMESGDIKTAVTGLNKMLEEQKRNEDNTGNPLGPPLEALKFFYRTPIQILKGASSITDPNIGLADLIVKGAAMAGNLSGQKIDIPYSLASLALLPFPLFNGVAPPIPPLSTYNVTLPLGPIFLGLEQLLWDLPYYQNRNKGKLPTGDGKPNPYNNPLFCELSDEENSEE